MKTNPRDYTQKPAGYSYYLTEIVVLLNLLCKNSQYLCIRKETEFLSKLRTSRKKLNRQIINDMEKNIAYGTEAKEENALEMAELFKRLGKWAKEPIGILRDFYAECLEENITIKQTWRLLEAQAAFIMAIIPADLSITVRVLLLGWFASAALRCRRAMKE